MLYFSFLIMKDLNFFFFLYKFTKPLTTKHHGWSFYDVTYAVIIFVRFIDEI